MGQLIDISSKITNELPMIKISDELIITVNNRKSVILNVQAFITEYEKKSADPGQEYDEMKLMLKVLTMIVGAKNAKAIDALDLPLPEYKTVYETVMNAATGDYSDTPTR